MNEREIQGARFGPQSSAQIFLQASASALAQMFAYLARLHVPATLWLCLGAAAVAAIAWTDTRTLFPLTLLLALPVLIFRAENRIGAFLVAFAYYGTATRAVPGIICGFFPSVSLCASLALWALDVALLATPWAIFCPPQGASDAWRAAGAAAALVVATVPPVGLFHWGTPLMVAGVLYPGWNLPGLFVTAALLALLTGWNSRSLFFRGAIAAAALLAVLANAIYRAPAPPQDWRAVSLTFGKNPEVWSDTMTVWRESVAVRAMREMADGAHVVIFPEAIVGSNQRPLTGKWPAAIADAKARGAIILVGVEYRNKDHRGFKNALVGYGNVERDGSVLVSSHVPMPVGDWKFGFDDGADTDVFGDDVLNLYGRKVAFSICYEDFLIWPHRGLLLGKADLFVSVSNQWPSSGTSAEISQDISRQALARLAGVPLLTAKNR